LKKNRQHNPAANRDVRICSGRIYTLYAGVAGMYIDEKLSMRKSDYSCKKSLKIPKGQSESIY
jgi:hypothetical protein